MNRRFGLLLAPVAILAMFAVTGCGSSNDDKDSGSSTSTPAATSTGTTDKAAKGKTTALAISADPSGALKFDTDKLDAKAGKVTIVMDNPSDVPHAVSIDGNGVDEEGTGGAAGVGKGEKSTVTADLKPGKYTFYCPVDSHEQAGMKGTLTVN